MSCHPGPILGHADIFAAISPDILHQLHKGVVKDHLLSWCQSILGKDGLDARFRTTPGMHGPAGALREGYVVDISVDRCRSQELQKVLLGAILGCGHGRVLQAVRAGRLPPLRSYTLYIRDTKDLLRSGSLGRGSEHDGERRE